MEAQEGTTDLEEAHEGLGVDIDESIQRTNSGDEDVEILGEEVTSTVLVDESPFRDVTNVARKRPGDKMSRETKPNKPNKSKKRRMSKLLREHKEREDLAEVIFSRVSHLDERTTTKLGIFVKKKGIVGEGNEFELDLYGLSLESLKDLESFLDEEVVCYYCGESGHGDSPFVLCETKAKCGNYCCGRGAHEGCIQRHLDENFKTPEGEWFCKFCT